MHGLYTRCRCALAGLGFGSGLELKLGFVCISLRVCWLESDVWDD